MDNPNILSAFEKLVAEHTIQDFYTPNIKAEVILDMLLTPYIPAIIEAKTGKKATPYLRQFEIHPHRRVYPSEQFMGGLGKRD